MAERFDKAMNERQEREKPEEVREKVTNRHSVWQEMEKFEDVATRSPLPSRELEERLGSYINEWTHGYVQTYCDFVYYFFCRQNLSLFQAFTLTNYVVYMAGKKKQPGKAYDVFKDVQGALGRELFSLLFSSFLPVKVSVTAAFMLMKHLLKKQDNLLNIPDELKGQAHYRKFREECHLNWGELLNDIQVKEVGNAAVYDEMQNWYQVEKLVWSQV